MAHKEKESREEKYVRRIVDNLANSAMQHGIISSREETRSNLIELSYQGRLFEAALAVRETSDLNGFPPWETIDILNNAAKVHRRQVGDMFKKTLISFRVAALPTTFKQMITANLTSLRLGMQLDSAMRKNRKDFKDAQKNPQSKLV